MNSLVSMTLPMLVDCETGRISSPPRARSPPHERAV